MKKLSLLLVLFVTTLVLAGCGDKQVKVQGVTDTEIKVANCASTTGAASVVGVPFNAGIQAYFDMVNEAGGIDGRQINFIHKDDESDVAKAKACIDEMMNDEEVFGIVGHFGSGQVAATIDDLVDYGMPTVYFASGLAALYNEEAKGNERVLFPVQPILVMEGRLMVARAVQEVDAKKFGVLYTNDDAGTDMITGIRNQVEKLGDGYSLVDQSVTVGASDFSAGVAKIMEADVDVVIVATIQATFTPLVKELAKQNNTAPVFTSYNNADATLIGLIKESLLNSSGEVKFDVYSNAWVDLSDVTALTLFATEIVKSSGKAEYASNAFATAGWIAGHFFVEGLRNHPEGEELTWASYMDALESKPIKNPFGGEISYADGKRLGTEQMSLLKIGKADPAVDAWSWIGVQPIAGIEDILAD